MVFGGLYLPLFWETTICRPQNQLGKCGKISGKGAVGDLGVGLREKGA